MNTQKQRPPSNISQQTFDPKDKNLLFINNLASQYEEEDFKNNKKSNDLLNLIETHLKGLDDIERQQWAHVLQLKCANLHKKSKNAELKSNIRKLVLICNSMKIPYNKQLIERIIKPVYYEKYGDDILKLFSKVGYNIQQYQFISYSEPWYMKILNFISD